MMYLLHRAVLRVSKNRKRYVPMALQITVGVCMLSIALTLTFDLDAQTRAFSRYLERPFASVSSEFNDASSPVTASDMAQIKARTERKVVCFRQYLSAEPFTVLFADRTFFAGIMGAEREVSGECFAGDNAMRKLADWVPADEVLAGVFDPEDRSLFGIPLREATPLEELQYTAPGLLSAIQYAQGTLEVTSFADVLVLPLEAGDGFPCQSIVALPFAASDGAEIAGDLQEIQSYLAAAHPDGRYRIRNYGEEVQSALRRNETLAATVSVPAGFVLVIVCFGMIGLLLVLFHQRRREYAVALLCGASVRLLLIESYLEIAVLVIFGTLLGSFSAIPFLPLFEGMGVSVHFSGVALAVCMIGAVSVSLLVCLASFYKIRHLSPVRVLKDL